jgi:hypothetical protein
MRQSDLCRGRPASTPSGEEVQGEVGWGCEERWVRRSRVLRVGREPGDPCGGLTEKLSDVGMMGIGAGVVTQDGVEDPAAAVVQDEGHGVDAAVDLGCGVGEDMDGCIARETGVEFIEGFERFEAAGDGMVGVGDLDTKEAMRIVATEVRVPDTTGEADELRPFMAVPCAAGEVGEEQSLAAVDESAEILARGGARAGDFPIHEVENDGIPEMELRGGEGVGILDDLYFEAGVLFKELLEGGRSLAPWMSGVIDAGDEENAGSVVGRGEIDNWG